jgi:hypothetical protein
VFIEIIVEDGIATAKELLVASVHLTSPTIYIYLVNPDIFIYLFVGMVPKL